MLRNSFTLSPAMFTTLSDLRWPRRCALVLWVPCMTSAMVVAMFVMATLSVMSSSSSIYNLRAFTMSKIERETERKGYLVPINAFMKIVKQIQGDSTGVKINVLKIAVKVCLKAKQFLLVRVMLFNGEVWWEITVNIGYDILCVRIFKNNFFVCEKFERNREGLNCILLPGNIEINISWILPQRCQLFHFI